MILRVRSEEFEALNKSLLQLHQEQVKVSRSLYAQLLQHCANATALAHGKYVHAHMLARGFLDSSMLKDLLIRMYERCGSLDDALLVFESLHKRSLFAWKSVISAYTHKGLYRQALTCYRMMKSHDAIEADHHLFARVLGCCTCLGDLEQGESIHAEALFRKLESVTLVATALVNMYGKCGRLETARKLFDDVPDKDIVCWNAMLTAYSHNQASNEVLRLYKEMVGKGGKTEPNDITYACVLGACSVSQNIEEGVAVHSSVKNTRFISASLVQNALITFYSSCRRLDVAKTIFDQAKHRNVVSWNALMAGCVQNGDYKQALELYQRMDHAEEHVQPDAITFTTVLGACSCLEELEAGKLVHARIVRTGLKPDTILQVALLNMYATCGSMELAKEVFEKVQHKTIIAWNVMIVAYAEQECSKQALELYKQLQSEGVQPDELTVASAVSACANLKLLKQGKKIGATYLTGRSSDQPALRVQNALLSMYARCGKLDAAKSVFDEIEYKDVVSWTGMISGCANHGDCGQAVHLYRLMNLEGHQPNQVTLATVFSACSTSKEFLQDGLKIHSAVCASGSDILGASSRLGGHVQDALYLYRKLDSGLLSGLYRQEENQSMTMQKMGLGLQTALLNLYSKSGNVKFARRIFDEMKHRDVVSWNAMISAYTQSGQPEASLKLYEGMVAEGMQPNASTFTNVLVACTSLGELKAGRRVHAQIVRSGFEYSIAIATSLINMYAKCGRVELAGDLFHGLKKKSQCASNLVAWNSMVGAYAHHGHGEKAVCLFQEMLNEGVSPNDVTLMSVLVGCGYTGLDSAGRMIFMNMLDDHGVEATAEHYICMVDILARCGKLKECEELILSMPFHPHVVAWNSLLGGSRDHGDVVRGHRIAKEILKLDPNNTLPYNLLLVQNNSLTFI